MNSDFEDIKREVAAANRVLANLGLAAGVTAALGHASMRVPSEPNHFFVKGREYEFDALAIMEPDDMVMCDTDGFLIAGRAGLTQCSEVKIHACIYKMHPRVQAIVHVHPRYTILMSVLTGSLKPMRQEGAQLVRDPLPIYPHVKTIQSDAEGTEVATLLGDSPVILLRGHGAVTTGSNLSEAVMGMVQLEEQAQLNYLAYCAEGKDYTHLTHDLLDEMVNRTPLYEQPHFKDVLKGRAAQRDGIWNYQKRAATRDN
ncbi:MAG TPA: class II aldolase/adducin family protein [Candidatus Binatia bacterium]|jgi:L-fuculose-phosphate aldolase|nr:class II aldolase/adducin family protein [Candidatus Binatia bacterium]